MARVNKKKQSRNKPKSQNKRSNTYKKRSKNNLTFKKNNKKRNMQKKVLNKVVKNKIQKIIDRVDSNIARRKSKKYINQRTKTRKAQSRSKSQI